MTKTRLLILLALILLLWFIPSSAAKGDVKQIQVTAPVEQEIVPPVPLTPLQMIEKEFADAPIMVHIARAENRGFDPKAKNPNSSASGLFQILRSTWISEGCVGEVFSPSDNIACARILYNRYGTRPWNESKHNWGQYL